MATAQEFKDFKLKNIYKHEGKTKLINSSNIDHLNEIINWELLSRENQDNPFIVVHFDESVLPKVYDQHIANFLATKKIPENEDSPFYPYFMEVANLLDADSKNTGIFYDPTSIPYSRGISKSNYTKELNELKERVKEVLGDEEIGRKEVESGKGKKKKKKVAPPRRPSKKKIKLNETAEHGSESLADASSSLLPSSEDLYLEETVVQLPTTSSAQLDISGGVIQPANNLSANCPCGEENCQVPEDMSHKEMQNKPFLHAAYAQQYKTEALHRKFDENGQVTPTRQLELVLLEMIGLGIRERTQCCYPVIKTLLKFEGSSSSLSKSTTPKRTEFNLATWTSFIRRCFEVEIQSGITYPWTYVGLANTLFMTHVEDYFAVNSVNLSLYGGEKVWIFIHPNDKETFENYLNRVLKENVKRLYDGQTVPKNAFSSCFPGHKIYFVHPLLLEKEGIKYTVVVQRVGDMIVTKQGSYHYGINVSINVAQSQNMIFQDFFETCLKLKGFGTMMFKSVPFCPAESCAYKTSKASKETLVQVFNFLLKVYEFLLIGNKEQIENLQSPALTKEDVAKYILYEMDPERYGQFSDIQVNVLDVIRRIRMDYETRLSALQRAAEQYLYRIRTCAPIQLSAKVIACTFEAPITLKKLGPRDFSVPQMNVFLGDALFETVWYRFQDLTLPTNPTYLPHRTASFNEICKLWNEKPRETDLKWMEEGQSDDKRHPENPREICKMYLNAANQLKRTSASDAILFFNAKNGDTMCLLELSSGKRFFICLLCHEEGKSGLRDQIKSGTFKNTVEEFNNETGIKYTSIQDPKLTNFQTGVFKHVNSVCTHSQRQRGYYVCDNNCEKKGKSANKQNLGNVWTNALHHFRIEHEKWRISCPFCGLEANSPAQFRNHLRSNVRTCVKFEFEEDPAKGLVIQNVFCGKCSHECENLVELKAHLDDSTSHSAPASKNSSS